MNESIDQPINRSPTPRPTHPHPHSRSPIVAVVVIVIESDVTSAAIVVIVALSSSPASLSLSSSSRRRRHHRHCRHRHHRVLWARCPADIYIHIFTYMFIGSTAFGYVEVVGKYVRANTSKLGVQPYVTRKRHSPKQACLLLLYSIVYTDRHSEHLFHVMRDRISKDRTNFYIDKIRFPTFQDTYDMTCFVYQKKHEHHFCV